MKEEILEVINKVRYNNSEYQYIEIKDSLEDKKKIGETISAVYNSALYLNKDYSYIIWGLEDKTWKYTDTSFDINKNGLLTQILKAFNNRRTFD